MVIFIFPDGSMGEYDSRFYSAVSDMNGAHPVTFTREQFEEFHRAIMTCNASAIPGDTTSVADFEYIANYIGCDIYHTLRADRADWYAMAIRAKSPEWYDHFDACGCVESDEMLIRAVAAAISSNSVDNLQTVMAKSPEINLRGNETVCRAVNGAISAGSVDIIETLAQYSGGCEIMINCITELALISAALHAHIDTLQLCSDYTGDWPPAVLTSAILSRNMRGVRIALNHNCHNIDTMPVAHVRRIPSREISVSVDPRLAFAIARQNTIHALFCDGISFSDSRLLIMFADASSREIVNARFRAERNALGHAAVEVPTYYRDAIASAGYNAHVSLAAGINGNRQIIDLLYEYDFPMQYAYIGLALRDDIEGIKYLHSLQISAPSEAYYGAIVSGKLAAVQALDEIGCPFSFGVSSIAVNFARVDILKYVISCGCHIDVRRARAQYTHDDGLPLLYAGDAAASIARECGMIDYLQSLSPITTQIMDHATAMARPDIERYRCMLCMNLNILCDIIEDDNWLIFNHVVYRDPELINCITMMGEQSSPNLCNAIGKCVRSGKTRIVSNMFADGIIANHALCGYALAHYDDGEDMVMKFIALGFRWNNAVISIAAYYGAVNLITYLVSNHRPRSYIIRASAVEAAERRLLVGDKSAIPDVRPTFAAVVAEKYSCLCILFRAGFNRDIMHVAIQMQSTSRIANLVGAGAPLGPEHMLHAVRMGNLSIVKALYEHGCASSPAAAHNAARCGHFEILEFLVLIGCSYNKRKITRDLPRTYVPRLRAILAR